MELIPVKSTKRILAEVSGEPVIQVVLEDSSGTQLLKINNQLVGSVLPGSTLLIERHPASGVTSLVWAGAYHPSLDVLVETNKHVIMDLISL